MLRGLVSEEDVAKAVAAAGGFEYVKLREGLVDPAALRILGEKVLRRYAALPLRVEDDGLVLAVSDPTDVLALDDLEALADLPIKPVVAAAGEIRHLQDRVFGIREEVHEFLEGSGGRPAAGEPAALSVVRGDGDAPVVRLVNSVIRRALGEGASDVHFEPREEELVVRYRVDGVLRRVTTAPLGLRDSVVSRLKILAGMDIAERRLPQDGRFTVLARPEGPPVDVRVASLPSVRGEKVVLRLLAHDLARVRLGELGLSPGMLARYRRAFSRPYGAVVVTGPTGSGKSTTLYTTLEELNDEERNIVTVEDPVEYRMEGATQLQVNPIAGLTFASGLRHILRGDPDVVMVGEIRDRETAEISVEAALTGHLVLATLHTNDAAGAIPRLTNMGVDPYLTTSAVGCVVAQRLVRRLCEACKVPVTADERLLGEMGFPFGSEEGERAFFAPKGCEACGGEGYRGRIGIYELMPMNEEIVALSLERQSADEISRAAVRGGMVRMRADGLLKAARGITPIAEVLRTTVS
ncbi:type II secretion system protein GspE [Rubrobacter marinus]|uniref:Type II secretion system protein GspE n=1 Tax=Rubrobacter marinus TaxID=2653852 RepID=A0A6G8PUY4_9ACTN|nr:GspE/PulE family protein [Rubrobacter marinus]QIN77955.1 type II secretion system protein GspE [Rubrobacter marinus]